MRRRVRELVRPGDVAAGEDVREQRLQVVVGLDGLVLAHRDAQLLKPEPGDVGHAPDGDQDLVERQPHLGTGVFADEDLLAVLDQHLPGLVTGQHRDAVPLQRPGHDCGDFGVFTDQDARQHLHLRHLGAEAREALRQLAADRAAAQHHQAFGQFAQVPDGVAGQVVNGIEAGDRRYERPRARGDDDVLVVIVCSSRRRR